MRFPLLRCHSLASDRPVLSVNAQKAPLSCRLHISLQGLEWFIYNRTAAYDNVASAMHFNFPDASEAHARMSGDGVGQLRKIFSWTSVVPECMYSLYAPQQFLMLHQRPTLARRYHSYLPSTAGLQRCSGNGPLVSEDNSRAWIPRTCCQSVLRSPKVPSSSAIGLLPSCL